MKIFTALLLLAGIIAALSAFPATGQAADRPIASFDWTMRDRFGLDQNNDGLVDYFPETSSLPGLNGEINPATFSVRLDGCASSGDVPIVSYTWEIPGASPKTTTECVLQRQFAEGTFEVTLVVEDDDGQHGVFTKDVVVQDWLIVALGDSYGSGEGSPDEPVPLFMYNDLATARQNLADAEADLDAALVNLNNLEADFDDTVAATAAVAFPCGWRDTDNNGSYETFDLFLVHLINCPAALITVGLEGLGDAWDAIGEVLNDLVATAEAAVGVASAAYDLAAADFQQFTDEVFDLENSLKATWQDRRCHRSARAGVAQAALELEQMDPRTSVTFVHLACSGGELQVGLLQPYQGVQEEIENAPLNCGNAQNPGPCLPSQINRAAQIVGDREVDVLFMSAGGNDANFAPIVQACIVLEPCHIPPANLDPVFVAGSVGVCSALVGVITIVLVPFCVAFLDDLLVEFGAGGQTAAEFFDEGIAELEAPGLYQQVTTRFAQQLPDLTDDRVYITQYPNATQNDDGSHCPDFFPQNNLPGLSLAEGTFADNVVTLGLNEQVEANAALEGWNFIGGVYDAFELHGYCADDHWIRRMDESFFRQGNHTGVVHPNEGGQAAYRDLILPEWLEDLYTGGDLGLPRRPGEPPIADAGGPYSVAEGSSIMLDGSESSSPDGDPFTFLWSPTSYADGSTLTRQTTANPTFNAADNGSHGVTLRTTDDDGFTEDAVFVNVGNVPPSVSIGADATVAEGATLTRAGSFTDPSTVDTHTAVVNYGDGSGPLSLVLTPSRTFVLSHVYADDGPYTVTVCVIDDDFGVGCDSMSVVVSNVAPTVGAGADAPATEGHLVSLGSATFNDKGTLDTHLASIDWGDGTPTGLTGVFETPFGPPGSTGGANGSVAGSHVYADDGAYTVMVCVGDDDGESACDSLIVNIGNAAPSVDAGTDQTANEGSTVALAPALFNDLGTGDTHTATLNWGDGSPVDSGAVTETPFGPPGSTLGASGSVAGAHVYRDNGVYTVTVCVTDDNAGAACDTLLVTVLNVPPALTINQVADGAPFALVLAPVDLDASFADPGVLDTHTATVDWGDGSVVHALGTVTSPFSAVHQYAAPGAYTITVTLTDDDGGVDAETVALDVFDPLQALDRTIDSMYALMADPGTSAPARLLLLSAIARLEGNNGGGTHNGAVSKLQNNEWTAALVKIEQAMALLYGARAVDWNLDLGHTQLLLSWTARAVAVDVVGQADAVARPGRERRAVNEAKALITLGDGLLSQGLHLTAAESFRRAVGKVEDILN